MLSVNSGDEIYPLRKAQIAHLKVDKASIKILSKYADFADVFLPKLAAKLPKYTRINNFAIELIDNQHSPYGSIYNLDQVKLKILKTYIDNNLANNFIKFSKSLARASIFFDKKSDRRL